MSSGNNQPDIYALEPEPHRQVNVYVPPVVAAPVEQGLRLLCSRCGYSLKELRNSTNCPECGWSIANSMRGNLLEFSSPEYVSLLYRGLALILISTIAGIALILAGVLVKSALSVSNISTPSGFGLLLSAAALPISWATLLGWWMFSARDPGVVSGAEGQTPRLFIRACVIALMLTTLADFLTEAAGKPLTLLFLVMSGTASIAMFFASMVYVRWLALRIPDQELAGQAKTYLWVLPLVFILGACLLVGQSVALILYLLILNQVRLKLGEIREERLMA